LANERSPTAHLDGSTPRRILCGVALFSAFLLVLLWGSLALHLVELRDNELQQAESDVLSRSRTIAEYAYRLLRAIDHSLIRLEGQINRDGENFDLTAAIGTDPFLKDVAFRVMQTSAEGLTVAGTPNLPIAGYVGDQSVFQSLKRSDGSRMQISEPTKNRYSGTAEVWFNRRVTGPDGSFGGVISVSIDPRYFSNFFSTVDIGKQGFISLVGLDGIVRARAALDGDTRIGQNLSNARLFAELQRQPQGTYNSISQIGAIPSIVGYRTLADYPMVVAVGESRDEILDYYYRERVLLAAIAVVLSLIFLGAAGLLAHQVTVQQRVETLLREREAELTESRNQAEEANRTKTEFLANMSHELRTPLNAIIGFSEIMIDGMMGPIGSPRYVEYAKDIHRSGTHLLDMISGILDMSKIEAGHYKLSFDQVDVADLARVCMRIVAGRADQGQIVLIDNVPRELPLLNADSRAIRQILLNLLTNAIKFTLPGGHAMLSAEAADGVVALIISDSGVGIPGKDLTRILEPFQQVETALNRKHDGAGLGLSITKKLVDLHNGVLEIVSQVGVGTTVTVRLPGAQAIARPQSAE
jgi:signal transduction histidine kinase